MLRLMGSQRVEHDWATELNSTELTDGALSYQNLNPGKTGSAKSEETQES